MKRLIIVISLFLSFLTQCKTARKSSAENLDANALQLTNSQQIQTFTLKFADTKENGSIILSVSKTFDLYSPLIELKVSFFEEAQKLGLYVLDFRANGSLSNVSNSFAPPTSCYTVGLYSYLSASNKIQYILLSSFSKKSPVALSQAVKMTDFQYCETEKAIDLTLAKKIYAFPLLNYLEARGFSLSDADKSLALGSRKFSKFEIIDDYDASKRPASELQSSGEHVAPLEGKPAPDKDLLQSWVHIETPSHTLDQLQSRSFEKQIAGNAEDEKVYNGLEIKLGNEVDNSWSGYFSAWYNWAKGTTAVDNFLGQGAFAKVYKVTIDGKDYAVRIEKMPPYLDKEQFKAQAEALRMNYLVQNEFAKLHPDAGFIRVPLSFYSETKGEFLTLMEYKGGGELHDFVATKDFEINPQVKMLLDQLHNQLKIYHKGIPIVIGGKPYNLIFAHGDIKPQNVVLDTDQKTASFIDFGLSRMFLKDDKGAVYEMVGSKVIPAKFSANTAARGTPLFKSPEFWNVLESKMEFTGPDCLLIELNSDIYAMNLSAYVALIKDIPSDIKKTPTLEALSKYIQKVVTPRMGTERGLVDPQLIYNEGTLAWLLYIKIASLDFNFPMRPF